MRSRTPKMLHEICGRPMIDWTVGAAVEAGAGKVVVVGSPDGALDGRLPDGVVLAVEAADGARGGGPTEGVGLAAQPEQKGTGGGVRAAADGPGGGGSVIIVNGVAPRVTPAALRALVDAHGVSGAAATIVTMTLEDP